MLKNSDTEETDKETDKEETDNDGSQNLNVGYSFAPDGYALCDSWWDVTEAAKNGNKRIRLAADITQTSCFWYGGGDTYTFDGAGHTIYVRFSSHGDPAINGSFIVRGGNLYIRNTIFDFGNSYDAPCGIVLDAHTQNSYCKAQNITMRNAKATFNGSAKQSAFQTDQGTLDAYDCTINSCPMGFNNDNFLNRGSKINCYRCKVNNATYGVTNGEGNSALVENVSINGGTVGIYTGGNIKINKTEVQNCTTGVRYLKGPNNGSTVIENDSKIHNNQTGVLVEGTAPVTVTNSNIYSNIYCLNTYSMFLCF